MVDVDSSVKKSLSRWKWFFFRQKYRFDLGHQFLAIMNFTLLLIAASDKLRYYTNIERTWMLIAIAVPIGFMGMWLFGYFLDSVIRYGQAYNIEASKRNPIWDEQKEYFIRIEQALRALEKKAH